MKSNKEQLEKIKKKIKETQKKIKELENLDYKNFKKEERKERAYNLILAGTIFEKVDLLKDTFKKREEFIGYLLEYKELSDEKKIDLKKKGILFLENKKIKKNEEDNSISNDEIKILLEIIKNKKEIDIFFMIQKKYKKNLLERLTKKEFKEILNLIEKRNT